MLKLIPSCAETARRLSQQQDGELSRSALIGMRLHLACCRFCRRYARQMRFLHESMHAYADRLDSLSAERLSVEGRRRMVEAMRRAS
jgi:hypothetical protein